jgi:hypothetical protein
MGSRRSYSLSAVVGKGTDLSASKGALTKAMKEGDAGKVVASSAELVAKSPLTSDFFYHGLKLLDALNRLAPGAKNLSAEALDKQIRNAWSSVKRVNEIADDKALDQIVIDAAKQALGAKKR